MTTLMERICVLTCMEFTSTAFPNFAATIAEISEGLQGQSRWGEPDTLPGNQAERNWRRGGDYEGATSRERLDSSNGRAQRSITLFRAGATCGRSRCRWISCTSRV